MVEQERGTTLPFKYLLLMFKPVSPFVLAACQYSKSSSSEIKNKKSKEGGIGHANRVQRKAARIMC